MFYVTSECIPDVVVTTRLNNSAIREYEDANHNEDEKYLHEPMTVEDIVEWKLVSPRLDRPGAPKHWNYWTGLDMPAVTGRDGETYHKTCTFALVQRTPKYFEYGVEYGFSIAETDSKVARETPRPAKTRSALPTTCTTSDTCWATWRCGNARSERRFRRSSTARAREGLAQLAKP